MKCALHLSSFKQSPSLIFHLFIKAILTLHFSHMQAPCWVSLTQTYRHKGLNAEVLRKNRNEKIQKTEKWNQEVLHKLVVYVKQVTASHILFMGEEGQVLAES